MPVKAVKNGFRATKKRDDVTKDVALDFEEDGELNLVIVPSRFTVGLQRRITEASNDNDIARMADLFFSVVKTWDMVDESGEVMPMDQSTIDDLSLDTFFKILSKLGESIGPKEETSNS